MEIRLSGHGAYRTEYHVVWITKYRRRVLNSGLAAFVRKSLLHILRSMPGVEIIELNIQEEHVHTLIVIPPKYSVSDVVGRLKGQSASFLRKRYSWLGKVYRARNIVWSPGYFVSTIGIDEEVIRRYIKYQQAQDSGQAKLDL